MRANWRLIFLKKPTSIGEFQLPTKVFPDFEVELENVFKFQLNFKENFPFCQSCNLLRDENDFSKNAIMRC